MKQYNEATRLRQQFKRNNTKNFIFALVLQTILNMKDTMRIVVTHRLDAPIMRQYDEILVLHNGKIEETGTFEELLEQKGYFYSLYHISQ